MVHCDLIKAIENAKEVEVYELLNAVLERYRELNPEWNIIYYAINKKDPKEYKRQILRIIKFMIKYELIGSGKK